jgi:hypothetical protein
MRKKLKVVELPCPWSELRAALTGNPVADRRAITDFCARHGISRTTALSRVGMFSRKTTPTEQNRNIRSGRR